MFLGRFSSGKCKDKQLLTLRVFVELLCSSKMFAVLLPVPQTKDYLDRGSIRYLLGLEQAWTLTCNLTGLKKYIQAVISHYLLGHFV